MISDAQRGKGQSFLHQDLVNGQRVYYQIVASDEVNNDSIPLSGSEIPLDLEAPASPSQFLMTQCLIPVLKKASSASVIFSSSSVGRIGKAYWGAYAVSKFAVEGFMQVLSAETKETSMIRVNSLDPGAVNTKMRRNAYPAEAQGKNPSPSQITNPWIYLLSDVSKQLSGQALSVQI